MRTAVPRKRRRAYHSGQATPAFSSTGRMRRFDRLSRMIGCPLRPAKMYPPNGEPCNLAHSRRRGESPAVRSVTVTNRSLCLVFVEPTTLCQTARRIAMCCSTRFHSSHLRPRHSLGRQPVYATTAMAARSRGSPLSAVRIGSQAHRTYWFLPKQVGKKRSQLLRFPPRS